MSKNAASCSRVSDGVNCPRCKKNNAVKNGSTMLMTILAT